MEKWQSTQKAGGEAVESPLFVFLKNKDNKSPDGLHPVFRSGEGVAPQCSALCQGSVTSKPPWGGNWAAQVDAVFYG